MIIHYLYHHRIVDFMPDILSIIIHWYWKRLRSHNQTVWLIQVKRPLPFPIAT